MNELIKIESRELAGESVQTINARDLHTFLENKRQFADWVKQRLEQFGFVEGEDYLIHKFVNNPLGGRPTLDYHLTLEMAKELAMVENNEKGRKIRRYFIECERRAKTAANVGLVQEAIQRFNIPQSYPEAMRLAADLAEQKAAIEAKLAIVEPKANALDRIATHSDGSFCFTDAAKNLQVQPRKLILHLQAEHWIYRRPMGGSDWLAYQERIQQGLIEHKIVTGQRSDGTEWTRTQARITVKGMAQLAKLMATESVAV